MVARDNQVSDDGTEEHGRADAKNCGSFRVRISKSKNVHARSK